MAQIKIITQVIDTDVFGADHNLFPVATYTASYTEKYHQTFSLADTAAVVGWDPNSASAAVTAFSVAIMRTDATAGVYVEAGVNSTSTGAAWNSYSLVKDAVYVLGADDAYQDEATDAAFGNTASVFDKIRFVNPTTSTTVNVTLALYS